MMADNDDIQHSDNEPSRRERLTGLLALLADQVRPPGRKPTLQEIQDWHLGKLDKKRSVEVKSHVARDPECYQMWRDLIIADKEPNHITDKSASPLAAILATVKHWWTKPGKAWVGGGLVTAMVVLIAILLVPSQGIWSPLEYPVQAELDYDWPYANMTLTRGGEFSYRQKVALQAGLRVGIESTTQAKRGWDQALIHLPNTTMSCEKEANVETCRKETAVLKQVGIHVGVFYMACLDYKKANQQFFNERYWQQMTTAMQLLENDVKALNISPLQEKIQKIGSSNTKEQQCELVRDVIYTSY